MSTTSSPVDFSDLYLDLENRVRIETGVSASENQAKRYINTALQDMHLGTDYRFPWAERNAVITTQPEYTTGTLTATKGSTTIAGSSTAWDTNNDFSVANMRVGGKIQINGGDEIFEITAVASGTSATLNSKFTKTTVSSASYKYFEDEYALASDFLKPVDIQQFSDRISIDLIGRTEFRRRYPRSYLTGRPTVATLIDRPPSGNTTPVRKVRFYRSPDKAYTIPYSYITENLVVSSTGTGQTAFSADDDEPIVPKRYRYIIIVKALYWWYRDKKDDTRSAEVLSEYGSLMQRAMADTEIGASRPIIRPRIAHYRRRAKRPYGGYRV